MLMAFSYSKAFSSQEIISYGRNPKRKTVSGKGADARFHPPAILSGLQTVQTTSP